MPYQVRLRPSAERDFKGVARQIQVRVLTRLEALEADPRPPGVKRLKGEGGFLRIRVGDYRVIYAVEDPSRVVWVFKIGHRGDVYRDR